MLGKINLVKLFSLAAIIVFFATFVNKVFASDIIPIPTKPQQPIITPASPILNASSYILIDATSGKILAEKNADEKLPPASLTKLMTLYIIAGALKNGSIKLEDPVRVSKKAWQTDGSRMFIKAGDEVPVSELLKGIVVASGNDATVAMSEFIAGTEDAFTSVMNSQAKQLGMNDSHFTDSTGLPHPDHYSTARDFAVLAKALHKDFPDSYKLFSEKWFAYKGIKQPNRNRLLWRYKYADGLKTGYTSEAGYCLVASAEKDNMRLISVIMGSPSDESRTEDSMRLLTYGFRFYETNKLYDPGTVLTKARTWNGVKKEVPMGITNEMYVTAPTGQFKNLKAEIKLDEPIYAPIQKGKKYGTLNVVLGKKVIASRPIVALSDNQEGGTWRRINDSVGYHYNKFFTRKVEKANNG